MKKHLIVKQRYTICVIKKQGFIAFLVKLTILKLFTIYKKHHS